MVKVKFHYAS